MKHIALACDCNGVQKKEKIMFIEKCESIVLRGPCTVRAGSMYRCVSAVEALPNRGRNGYSVLAVLKIDWGMPQ